MTVQFTVFTKEVFSRTQNSKLKTTNFLIEVHDMGIITKPPYWIRINHSQPLARGLVSYSPLNEGRGDKVQDLSGPYEATGFANFINCAGTYYAQGGDILDITTEDFEISFWMKQDGDPASVGIVIHKGTSVGGVQSYSLYLSTLGQLVLRANDGTNDAYFYADITTYLDNRWHHCHIFVDRSDISACVTKIDKVSQALTTSGTFPTLTLANSAIFMLGISTGSLYNFEGNLRDLRIKIGGTMCTESQIIYQYNYPLDYSANSWTLDGTREAWELTEGTGTTCAAEVTSPTNDLTLSNASAWVSESITIAPRTATINGATWTGGDKGHCLSFDESDDYVETFDIGLTAAISIVLRLKYASGNYFLSKDAAGGTRGWAAMVDSVNSRLRWWVYRTGADFQELYSPNNSFDKTAWQHVVLTYENTGTFQIFIEGQLSASSSESALALQTNSVPITLGGYYRQGNYGGLIDSVSIYDRILSAEEIAWLYREPYIMFQ